MVNIILGILDLFVAGLILSPIWNAMAAGTLGVWLWIRTGQSLKATKTKRKKAPGPLVGQTYCSSFSRKLHPGSEVLALVDFSYLGSTRETSCSARRARPAANYTPGLHNRVRMNYYAAV